MAVGADQMGAEGQSIVKFALQVTALPQSSVARNVRVYTIGELPEEVSFSTTTSTFASQASLAKTEGQVGVAGKLIVVFAGQVMAGAVISRTVTVALQVDVLPQSSVALQIRV